MADVRREAETLLFRIQNAVEVAGELPAGTIAALRELAEAVEHEALPAAVDGWGYPVGDGRGALEDKAEKVAPTRTPRRSPWGEAEKFALWAFLADGGAERGRTREDVARAFLADGRRGRFGPGSAYSPRGIARGVRSVGDVLSVWDAVRRDARKMGVPCP